MAHTESNVYNKPDWETVPLRPECDATFMGHGNGYYTLSINGGGSGASVTLHLSDATIDEMVRLREEWTAPVKSDDEDKVPSE